MVCGCLGLCCFIGKVRLVSYASWLTSCILITSCSTRQHDTLILVNLNEVKLLKCTHLALLYIYISQPFIDAGTTRTLIVLIIFCHQSVHEAYVGDTLFNLVLSLSRTFSNCIKWRCTCLTTSWVGNHKYLLKHGFFFFFFFFLFFWPKSINQSQHQPIKPTEGNESFQRNKILSC